METSYPGTGGEAQSPTLPLPPPRAAQISMEDFLETATRAVFRAMSELNPQPSEGTTVELNPQPEPPGRAAAPLNPQPLPPIITIGIVFMPPAESVERSKLH